MKGPKTIKGWIKTYYKELITTGIIIVGTTIIVCNVNRLKKMFGATIYFDDWLMSATDEELDDAYEVRRLQWIKDGFGGTGLKTPEMIKIDRETSRRSELAWKNNPMRNKDPNYRWSDSNRWERD